MKWYHALSPQNFEKWLLVNGVPTQRYSSATSPEDIEEDIVAALKE